MTNRLTDEQVAELWERACQAVAYKRWQRCWNDAYETLSLVRPVTGPEWRKVKEKATELMSQRNVGDVSRVFIGDVLTADETIALLAEVRRARGME